MDENDADLAYDEGVSNSQNDVPWSPPTFNNPRPAFLNLREQTDEVDGLPEDLVSLLDFSGKKYKYKITLQKFSASDYVGRPNTLGEWWGEIPTMDTICKLHGPGHYRYVIVPVPTKSAKAGTNTQRIKHDFSLVGTYYENMFNEALENRELEEIAKLKSKKIKMDVLGPNYHNVQNDPAKALEVTLNAIKPLLDLNMRNQPVVQERKPLFTPEVIGGLATIVTGIFAMMQKSQENQMNMMLTLMTNNKKQESEEDSLERIIKMVERVNNVTNLLTPREESMADKIVTAISNNIPVLMGLLQMPKSVRDSATKPFEESPEIQALKHNKALLDTVITQIDKKLGAETTDKLLEGILKINRPPKNPSTETDLED